MITHIKENKPESEGKVLIGEIKTPTDKLIDEESPEIGEIKVWKDKKVKCYIRESQTLING